MSATKTRLDLARATELATELLELLDPCCRQQAIAGSIRRRAETVGDIELLVEPMILKTVDMFGETVGEVNLVDAWAEQAIAHGAVEKRLDVHGRSAVGERYKRLLYKDFPLDLFIVLPPAQWGVLLLIRTGPADYSHRFVSRLPQGYRVQNGVLWRYETPLHTPTEESVYEALGMPWMPPEKRT